MASAYDHFDLPLSGQTVQSCTGFIDADRRVISIASVPPDQSSMRAVARPPGVPHAMPDVQEGGDLT